MAAWPPEPPGPSLEVSTSPLATAATPRPTLEFEFWNDRQYQSYGLEDQQFLNSKILVVPRPSHVDMLGGKYTMQCFDMVEAGRAVQVNAQTRFERHVRLKPPYALPGASMVQLPGPVHFEFEDDGGKWRPYSSALQNELQQALCCAPPPAQFFFVEGGKAYWLLGLDSLLDGLAKAELVQVNTRSTNSRRVRLVPGPLPVAVPTPERRSWATSWVRGGGSASSSGGHRLGAGSSSHSYVSFSLRNAVFIVDNVKLPSDVQALLCESWRQEPRPAQVRLPTGELIELFGLLEVSGARMCSPPILNGNLPSLGRQGKAGSRLPLEVHLPMPAPGTLALPAALDVVTSCSPLAYGRSLSNREVLQLSSRGPEATQCSICLCEMELCADSSISAGGFPVVVDDDMDVTMADRNPDFSLHSANNPPSATAALDAATSSVFELQCGHAYHTDCINQWFEQRRRCPQCQKDFGKIIGDQPRCGTFQWHSEPFALRGHLDTTETIIIQFDFPAGVTEQGTQYEGRKPKGYLPGNAQGIVLLELFKIAFRRCVMFGLGNSMTFGTLRPTFNIHIKTSTHRGIVGHGFPDDTYFKRALEELRTNGVTIADLPI